MIGETVELTCAVGNRRPDLITIMKDGSKMEIRKLDDTKQVEWRQGISISLRQVGLSDAGNYTCEATWNESDYTRKDTYILHVIDNHSQGKIHYQIVLFTGKP